MYLCGWSVSSGWIIGHFYGDDPLWDGEGCRGNDHAAPSTPDRGS